MPERLRKPVQTYGFSVPHRGRRYEQLDDKQATVSCALKGSPATRRSGPVRRRAPSRHRPSGRPPRRTPTRATWSVARARVVDASLGRAADALAQAVRRTLVLGRAGNEAPEPRGGVGIVRDLVLRAHVGGRARVRPGRTGLEVRAQVRVGPGVERARGVDARRRIRRGCRGTAPKGERHPQHQRPDQLHAHASTLRLSAAHARASFSCLPPARGGTCNSYPSETSRR